MGSFLVWGTYGGWVATLENPFGPLEAMETLGTLCVALCGDKVRTKFLSNPWGQDPIVVHSPRQSLLPAVSCLFSCLFCCSIVAAICMVRDDMRDARIVS